MDYDVIIVGGSFAGLSAALYLGRALRSVCVLDTGKPRNRFAKHSHGLFSRDGANPMDLLATARAQVAAYPSVTFRDQAALDVAGENGRFAVTLADGAVIAGRRLVLAYGLTDTLPDIPGLRERWGQSVIHCPYCHGYEFAGQRLGVLRTSPLSVHHAMLIPEWGPTTYYLNGAEAPDAEALAELARRNVTIVPEPVLALDGEGEALAEIVLEDGRRLGIDALYVGPDTRPSSDLAARLGCETEETPMGAVIRTDAMKATSVPGVWAAGDITRGAHSVTWAAGDGVTAGTAAHRSLVF